MTTAAEQRLSNLGNLLPEDGRSDRVVITDLRVTGSPRAITANEFQDLIQAFALGLRERGIQQGQCVGFLAANRWELLVGYLATMYMGGVAVPINYKLPADVIEHIVEDAGIQLMFCDAEGRAALRPKLPVVDFDEDGGRALQAFLVPGQLQPFSPEAKDLAEILYTSGSTGMPKGVPLNHQGQLWALEKFLGTMVGSTGERSLIVAPLYHMNGLFFSTICAAGGIEIVMQPRFDVVNYAEALESYQCSQLSGVPTMFALVSGLGADVRREAYPYVSRVAIGSAPLSDALSASLKVLFPNAVFTNSYGSTEAGPAIFGPHPDGIERPRMSIGYPFDGVEWRLVGDESPVEGVLELRTGALTEGYLNRDDATRETFVDGWYNTRDVMRRDGNGFFYFISRADDMFVCGGENIYPSTVEELVQSIDHVVDCVVVDAPDDIKGAVPVAFVVKEEGSPVDEDAIKQHCLSEGPAYAHPRRVVFKQVLPVGGTHKIDRKRLAAEARELMIADGRASA
ncbi:MAG: class I adenylate-forming enzyme family protein [Pseudomonadota bacterium]